jgi:hypothetical protein
VCFVCLPAILVAVCCLLMLLLLLWHKPILQFSLKDYAPSGMEEKP